jgi:hypothetical protein
MSPEGSLKAKGHHASTDPGRIHCRYEAAADLAQPTENRVIKRVVPGQAKTIGVPTRWRSKHSPSDLDDDNFA